MNELVNYHSQHLDGEFGVTNKVKSALKEAADAFIYIGFLLDEADRLGYYLEKGYSNIYEYCEAEFDFKRSSTNNFIRVYQQFGETMCVQDRYKKYSYSQLVEMCSMSESDRMKVKPEMTIKEIRDIKKNKAVGEITYTISDDFVQTSGREETYPCVYENVWVDIPKRLVDELISCVQKTKVAEVRKGLSAYYISIKKHVSY